MSVLGPLARGIANAGRYTASATRISRAARAGAVASAAVRSTRAARVARAEQGLLTRLARDAASSAPGARILPNRILDLTSGLSAQQKRELGLSLRTLLELDAIDPRLLRSATFGSKFPGMKDPAKLLRWLQSPEGKQAIARIPESRVYKNIAANVDQAEGARSVMRSRDAVRRQFIEEERMADAALERGQQQVSSIQRTQGPPGSLRGAAQMEAEAPAVGSDIVGAMQQAKTGALPVRGLLRELARSGDERARTFLRSAGKLEAPEPVPGKPGLFKIRSKDGRVYELDVRSEQVRNTPTGSSYFGRIEKELGEAGLSSQEVVDRVAQAGVGLDTQDTVLTRFMRRGRMDPGGTVNKALLATAGALDIGYFAGPPLAEGVRTAFGFEDTFDEESQAQAKRDLILRTMREQRRARAFVANEARLAALAPDLYNEALAGRRLAPGSRVYGAPQKTDDLTALLEMMSVGQTRQAFSL